MALENTEQQDDHVDLERTDRLPMLNLNPALIDDDVADDAVRLDMATVVPRIRPEYRRAAGVDAPSPADVVRALKERLDRQKADFEALSVAHERIRAAEQVAKTRVKALTAELSTLQTAFQTERSRVHQLEKSLADQSSTGETMRARLEDALRELGRHQDEARTLRGTLAERDAAMAQALSSLGERDSQLASLRRELDDAKLLVATHQELLLTRGWREGFDQNLVQDLEAKLASARAELGTLQGASDRLQQRVSDLESTLSMRDAVIAGLRAASDDDQVIGARGGTGAPQAESAPADVTQTDHKAELHRIREKLVIAEQTQASLRIELSRLQAEIRTREEEMGVLHAHLELARRPADSGDAQTQRIQQELVDKSKALEQALEENRHLSVALEGARSALEERESLIRRLESNEHNDAHEPGRIPTGVERMGMNPGSMERATPEDGALAQCMAEIARLDGENRGTYVLGRRTRIGRAPGCEIQVQSSSVSRHHALILVGVREVIVEDLNSTNGVLVNGHKTARQLLSDGDQLTIGEAQFKLKLKFDAPPAASPPPSDAP